MNTTNTTWGLLGVGTIGGEVLRQVNQPAVAERLGLETAPSFIIRSSGTWKPGADGELVQVGDGSLESLDSLPLPKVVFNALPSTGDGRSSELMAYFLKKGVLVVTAEKAALAYEFSKLKTLSENFKRMGINAAVGGGTRPLSAGRSHFQDLDNVSQVHMTLNGTVSQIMSAVASGATPEAAVQEAIALGYAEPGATDPATVFQQELEGDVPKKLAIFMNVFGFGQEISPNELSFKLDKAAVEEALQAAKDYRFIVSIYGPAFRAVEGKIDEGILGKFTFEHDGWQIVGGFRQLSANPLFMEFATLQGPGNCCLVGLGKNEEDGVNVFAKGPGAGPHATVNTMLDDYLTLKLTN